MNREPRLTTNHFTILEQFIDGFDHIHGFMEKKYKTQLLQHTPMMFQKWCFAALAEGTILSPANIFEHLSNNKKDEITGYALEVNPQKRNENKFSFYTNTYSVTNHPLVTDLKQFISFCTPDIEVDEQGFLLSADAQALSKKLSIQDTFYVEYLTLLAWKTNLLKHLSAIHSKRIQPTETCKSFFAKSTKDILKELLSITYIIASEKFSETLEADLDFFPPSLFSSYLEDAKEIDDMFRDIFSFIEIDIEDFWKREPEQNISSEDSAIFSSFYIVGILLDQWILSPLSIFYRFIEPISFSVFSFLNVLNRMTTHLIMEHNPTTEIFAPPTDYYFTTLGRAIIDSPIPRENIHELPEKLKFIEIENAIDHSQSEEGILEEMVMDAMLNLPIYTFRTSFSTKKEFWKLIEVSGETPLNVFCNNLAMIMGFELEPNYVLTIPDENGFQIDYTATNSRKSFHKTEKITLQELNLTPTFTMKFQNGQNYTFNLNITFQKETKPVPYTLYPRLKRQSRAFSLEESNNYPL